MAMKVVTVDDNNLGLKVEGDLGDLQIIEDTSESDNETNEIPAELQKGTVANIPNNLVKPSNTPVFGTVSVSNSENVQFGNNTFFNGPVTIKQVITRSGVDNPSYQKTENENNSKQKFQSNKNSSSIGLVKFKTWHKLSFCAVGIILFGGICGLVLIILQKDWQQSDNAQSSGDNSSTDDLLIAPDHLRIVSRTDWLAQPVEQHVDLIKQPVPWVIITHTATESCFQQSACVLRVRLIQTFHIESRNWSDIGYNFLVGGDGSAYYGRGWDQIGAHTKGYNKYSIAIAFIGTFNTESPTKNQVGACKKLINLGVAEGKLAKDYKLFAHRQLMSTLSPGDKVFDIIKTWPHFVNETDLTPLIPNY